jgi:hypothetical protein
MKTKMMQLAIPILLALMMALSLDGWGQTTVFSDDFSTDQSASWTTSGQIGSSAFSVSRSGNDWGARRNSSPAQLELTNDASATANVNGWVFTNTLTSGFSSPYNTTLSSNSGLVTWYFNIRQIRTDPAGFGAGSYGAAFIIATNNTAANNTGTGYAIVYGQSGTTDPIRLARFSGGLSTGLTNIITSNTSGLTDFGAEYISCKVTYNPSNNQWELFLRNDGASEFADPMGGTLTSQGTATDNTYTSTVLDYMGGYWQGSTGANQTAFFDNITVQVNSAVSPTITVSPSSLSGFTYLEGNGPSPEQNFSVSGSNLTADISIVPPTNYEISTGTGVAFVATNPITLEETDGSVASTPIYVRLKAGLSSGFYNNEEITCTSTGASSRTVLVSGSVVGPVTLPYNENFSDCNVQEWIAVSVASNRNWTCGSGYQEINAFGGDVASDDYLISPIFNLNLTSDEVLTFDSWTRFADITYPRVELLYTTNYSGDPSTTTWNNSLNASVTWSPENSQVWTSSGNISISGISGNEVRFAFRYTSSGIGSGTTSQWRIDNILVQEVAVADPGSFAATAVGSSQIDLSFTTNAGGDNVVIVHNENGVFNNPAGVPPAIGEPFAGGILLFNGNLSPQSHIGLSAQQTVYYKAFSYDGVNYSPGLTANATTPATEPTNHPTGFGATANSASAITVNWTDAVPAADGYLIKGSSVGYGNIVNPVDGTPEANGTLVRNVAGGVGSYQFTGLNSSTQHYFKIFPYNGSGTTINYKTDGSVPEATATTEVDNTTVLQPGDIAFIAYATDAPDRFAFVTFVGINANTQITFTDNGWKADNTWRTGENTGTWTAPLGGITAGSVIQIEGTTVTGGGTMSAGLSGLSSDGDQVIAYQGTASSPTFITAINMDWAVWQADATNTNTSAIPTGLTNNVNANAVTQENGYYNGPTSGTINFLKSAINNPANWVTTNTGPQTWPSWSFSFGNFTTLSTTATLLNLEIAGGQSLTIETTGKLTITGTLTNSAGSAGLVIESDATGTGSLIHNTDNVPATMQRYITGSTDLLSRYYHHVSIPLNNSVQSSQFSGSYLFSFNQATQTWNQITQDNVTLNNNQGYMIFYPNTETTYNFVGQLNNGAFVASTTTDAIDEYSLVPNPYPSAIDWDAATGWTKTNLLDAIWIWNPVAQNYAAYGTQAGTNGGSRYIAPGQAFFVKSSAASPLLSMNNNVRLHNAQAFFNTPINNQMLRVRAEANGFSDEAIVRFHADASLNYEANLDVDKLRGNEAAPQLFTLASDMRELSINTVPFATETFVMPLAFESGFEGEVVFSFSELNSFEEGATIFLEDKTTGEMIKLQVQQTYTFTHSQSNDPDRFNLHFFGVTGIDMPEAKRDYHIWSRDRKVYISIPELNGQRAQIEMFDVLGNKLFSSEGMMNSTAVVRAMNSGVAIVRVTSQGRVYTTKLFIQ